ncbi:MAG TPA: hypothetical protein VN108_06090 [Marmoricola sp.]|nr:hypothetical protein [Marmoricola sp.]
MTGRRILAAGPIFVIVAVAVISAGAIWPSADRVVALGVMLLLPLLAAIAGCVVLVIALTRSRKADAAVPVGRILAVAALVGLVLAFGFGALGIVSQIPDTMAGFNGSYVPGSAPGLAALTLGSEGVVAGLPVLPHPSSVRRRGGGPQRRVVADQLAILALLIRRHDAVAALSADLDDPDDGVRLPELGDHEPHPGLGLDGRQHWMPLGRVGQPGTGERVQVIVNSVAVIHGRDNCRTCVRVLSNGSGWKYGPDPARIDTCRAVGSASKIALIAKQEMGWTSTANTLDGGEVPNSVSRDLGSGIVA